MTINVTDQTTDRASDQDLRDLATDTSGSYIVQAPAGSGKTTLLVRRYLKLLAGAGQPEEILAITFTRKAASEMRGRVLERLTSPPGTDPVSDAVLARSSELQWQLLDQPSRLKIQTIDSFAMTLTRQLPVSSKFSPDMSLTESAGDFYQQAGTRLLQKLYDGHPLSDEIADFLLLCGNDPTRARRLLTAMLGKRDQWLTVAASVIESHRDDAARTTALLAQGRAELNRQVIEAFESACSAAEIVELQELVTHAAMNLGVAINAEHDLYQLAGQILVTQKDTLRKNVTRNQGFETDEKALKTRMKALLDGFRGRNLTGRISNLQYLPSPDVDPQDMHRLVTICVNLALASAELARIFSLNNTSDFTELILSAHKALGDELAPSDLALALDHRISHLLVDEFQDTSVSQFRLFEQLLSGWSPENGNTFFAVGDPMQSIYRFRDADVSLFYQAWEHGIADLPLQRLRLTSNFRATRALVAWHNRVFEQVLGDEQDPVMGRISYSPSVAHLIGDLNPDRGPGPHSAQTVGYGMYQRTEDQISAIVDRVRSLRDQGTTAILVRSRGQLIELLKALKEHNVTWHANDIDPLLNKPVVGDLLSALRALFDPLDRLAWMSVLRTPWVGLSVADLEAFAEAEDIPSALSEENPGLSEGGRKRVDRLLSAVQKILPLLNERPVRNILETFWLSLGGADAYEDTDALPHATSLLELIDELGADGGDAAAVTLAAENLFASDTRVSNLEILTIHKAKGLEFDHVILPFLEKTTQSDEAELLLFRPLNQGLLIGAREDDGCYGWLMREDRARARHELERLFYVACTRAKNSLQLFASPGRRPVTGSLLGLLWPLLWPEDGAPLVTANGELSVPVVPAAQEPSQPDLFETIESPGQTLSRLPANYVYQPPFLLPPLKPPPTLPPADDALEKRLEVALGVLVHSALEHLSRQPLPEHTGSYLKSRHRLWLTMVRSHGVDEEIIEEVVRQATDQVERVLDDPTGQWILGARNGDHSELPLTGVIDDKLTNVILDRSFVDQGTRWIVDYKSSSPAADESMERFVTSQATRYRGQLERYGAMAGEIFAEPLKLAIYFTAVQRLHVFPT